MKHAIAATALQVLGLAMLALALVAFAPPARGGIGDGDVNCDGAVTFADIDPFVALLISPEEFDTQYPGFCAEAADLPHYDAATDTFIPDTCDHRIDNFDIDAFVALLLGDGRPLLTRCRGEP